MGGIAMGFTDNACNTDYVGIEGEESEEEAREGRGPGFQPE